MIDLSGCPIAAPSANLFSHVSPTSPIHVFNDLYDKGIYLIDGETTPMGIESTVLKIIRNEGGTLYIMVLRNGSLSASMISKTLKDSRDFSAVEVFSRRKHYAI